MIKVDNSLSEVKANGLYLKLDQTTPQTISGGQPIQDVLTASKPVFTDASKKLTSTGIGTSSQFIKGDGSLDSSTYLTTAVTSINKTGEAALTGAVTLSQGSNITLTQSGNDISIGSSITIYGPYSNNAQAVAAGRSVGDFYKTGDDPDTVCVVH